MSDALLPSQQRPIAGPTRTPAGDMTAVRSWLRSKNSPHTQKAYALDIAVFYEQIGKSISVVTLTDIQDYAEWIRGTYSSIETQRRMLYAVKSLLTFAHKQGYIPFNVGTGLTPPKGKDTLAERILSPAQIQHIIYEAKKAGSQRNYVLILLLYASGIRCEEVCNLQWKDVKAMGESGQITVFGKERETRAVLLHQKAWDALQTIQPENVQPDDYVFASRQMSPRDGRASYRLTEARVWQIVTGIAKKAGVKASPHFFRHAHATHTMGKVSQRIIQETLGWKSPMVMMRYQHVMPSESSSLVLDL
jgi:integrase/recombinase XerD